MPDVLAILRTRQRRRSNDRKDPKGRVGLGCSTLVSLLTAFGFVALTLAYMVLSRGLPSLETLPALIDPPNGLLLQPTSLYDRSGEHEILTLQDPRARDKQYLYLDVKDSGQPIVPGVLISATLATADPTFWHHPGFSWPGIRSGRHTTLAQRLVFDLLLWEEPAGLQRNLRERMLAFQVTARFGRTKILEWYLNSADYGHLAFGADAAARVYFGKPATRLSLAEAALLAATAESPGINPLDAPQEAFQHQGQVIQVMLEQGLINVQQATEACQEKISINKNRGLAQSLAPAFTNLVLEQLETQTNRTRLERGGFRIISTLDYDLQLQAACAAANQIARLTTPPGAPLDELAAVDGSPCQASRLLPTLSFKGNSLPAMLEANVVVLDPQTGQIMAMVGKPSPGLDPAHLPGHPPGSLLTPFIYLTAFSRGLSPASLVWDIPGETPDPSIQNFDGKYHGPLRLRMAFANDYLVPAVQILAQIGPENAWRSAQQLGLVSLESSAREQAYHLPQDGGEITLLEASQAYGVFANQGVLAGRILESPTLIGGAARLKTVSVLRLEDRWRQKAWVNWTETQSQPVINPQLAYLVTNVLSDEVARWASLGHPNPLEIGRSAAAKIGQTSSGNDAWVIGFTPQLVVGVWLGSGRGETSGLVPPSSAAALWHAIIQYAHRNLPSLIWTVPEGLSKIDVCDPSGMLPSPFCPAVVSEIFIPGSEPTQVDNLYRALQINRETGRLATIFTPSELVEERVYLVVSPEAVEWAKQAGLPTPPESYDVITALTSNSSDVVVRSPAMFAVVKGKVSILGTATGKDFAFYRVQIGEGMNPQEWLQLGQNVERPVFSGELTVWDTSGLNGLYAIQVQVVFKDKRVETTIIQVTVDNEPPEVRILYPVEGQVVSIGDKTVTLLAVPSDNLSLQAVEFYMDNRQVGVLDQSPFAIPWQATLGQHTLRVKVVDQAGNSNEATVNFWVK